MCSSDLLIVQGTVAVQVTDEEGNTVRLRTLASGSSFGEQALIDDQDRRSATVVALEPVEVMVLLRDDFDSLREEHRSLDRLLIDQLSSRMRDLSKSSWDGRNTFGTSFGAPAQASPPKPSLNPGDVFGPYRIETMIGRGGMSILYRALDSRLGRRVALKVMSPEIGRAHV